MTVSIGSRYWCALLVVKHYSTVSGTKWSFMDEATEVYQAHKTGDLAEEAKFNNMLPILFTAQAK